VTTFRTQRLFHELNRQEYRFVIQNHGIIPTLPAFFDVTNFRGKFFHRGCHGWLETIDLYIRNVGAAQNVTIGISNFPGATEDSNYTTLAPPGDNWVSFTIRDQWNYDGLFIYVRAHGANTSWAWDACISSSQRPDSYYSTTGLIDGPYTRNFTAIDPGTSDRRYHCRANVSQSVGDVPVTGFVNIKEVEDFLRVVLTDEDGNITGVGLPLYATTIIGSDETHFNDLANDSEEQKTYAAGDPFMAGWQVGRDFYPYSVAIVLRAEHDSNPYPPCRLAYEGVYVSITSSDGQQIFEGTLGQDKNIDWDLIPITGIQYWQSIYERGKGDMMHRNIAADVSLTVLVRNASGTTLDQVVISILGATYPIA